MSEQKIRGIPHWRKFKEAANALEKLGAKFPPSFPYAKRRSENEFYTYKKLSKILCASN